MDNETEVCHHCDESRRLAEAFAKTGQPDYLHRMIEHAKIARLAATSATHRNAAHYIQTGEQFGEFRD